MRSLWTAAAFWSSFTSHTLVLESGESDPFSSPSFFSSNFFSVFLSTTSGFLSCSSLFTVSLFSRSTFASRCSMADCDSTTVISSFVLSSAGSIDRDLSPSFSSLSSRRCANGFFPLNRSAPPNKATPPLGGCFFLIDLLPLFTTERLSSDSSPSYSSDSLPAVGRASRSVVSLLVCSCPSTDELPAVLAAAVVACSNLPASGIDGGGGGCPLLTGSEAFRPLPVGLRRLGKLETRLLVVLPIK